MRHVVVGTAGHIDHGKSSLVEALTGTDPDRLKEEKARGITVDLGFAHVDDGGVRMDFVDVPGHERFVRNMLAGACGFDVVLLAVAADESVMPQTREHVEICRLLGVTRAVVALTRIDLVDDPDLIELVGLEVAELLEPAGMGAAPMVPVSAKTGAGLARLRRALAKAARAARSRDPAGPLRLPIDRAFTMRGFGVVVTGTLVSGTLEAGQEVELAPAGERARVRGVQVHGDAVASARAGQRVAANLSAPGRLAPVRGEVVADPGALSPTRMLDARIEVVGWAGTPLADQDRVHLHVGAAAVLARVRLLGGRPALAPGDSAYAQLRLESPVAASRGDRLILRRYSPVITIGGGEVLDARPPKRSPKTRAAWSRVRALFGASDREAAAAFVGESGPDGRTVADLARRLGVRFGAAAAVVRDLEAAGEVAVLPAPSPTSPEGGLVVGRQAARGIGERLLRGLSRWESENRLRPAVAVEHLREQAGLPARTAEWALGRLAAAGRVERRGGAVSTAGREIRLRPAEKATLAALADLLRSSGFAPPPLRRAAEVLGAPRERVDALRRLLAWRGEAVAVTPDLFFDRRRLEALRGEVVAHAATSREIDVKWFKDRFGLSRKHAIPLLEWLDRERVTVRVGNVRRIRAAAALPGSYPTRG